jgi:hypothetical protein
MARKWMNPARAALELEATRRLLEGVRSARLEVDELLCKAIVCFDRLLDRSEALSKYFGVKFFACLVCAGWVVAAAFAFAGDMGVMNGDDAPLPVSAANDIEEEVAKAMDDSLDRAWAATHVVKGTETVCPHERSYDAVCGSATPAD